jgi:hypothetical protein
VRLLKSARERRRNKKGEGEEGLIVSCSAFSSSFKCHNVKLREREREEFIDNIKITRGDAYF